MARVRSRKRRRRSGGADAERAGKRPRNRERVSRAAIADLPWELLDAVFDGLDACDLIACEWVCRQWRGQLARRRSDFRALARSTRFCKELVLRDRLGVLEWAIDAGARYNVSLTVAAARTGNVGLLERAYESGRPRISWKAALHASRRGDVRTLRWLAERGLPFRLHRSLTAAAECGHLDVLKWFATEAGRLMLGHTRRHDLLRACCYGVVTGRAALRGHLRILKWLFRAGKLDCGVFTIFRYASRGGHVRVLEWASRRFCILGCWERRLLFEAARGGSVETLEWLLGRGAAWAPEAPGVAARHGRLGVLRWMVHRGYAIRPSAVGKAIDRGHAAVLAFLTRDLALELPANAIRRAIRSGNIETLRYVRSCGVRWNFYGLLCAISAGYPSMLRWLIEDTDNGRKQMTADLYVHAARCLSLDALRCLKELGCPYTRATRDLAIRRAKAHAVDFETRNLFEQVAAWLRTSLSSEVSVEEGAQP